MRIPGVPYVQGRNDYTDSDGRKYGIAIHNTSNDASAEAEASYATRRTDGISAHLYVDRDRVVQSLDTDDRAGHAGSTEGNNHAVAVEITGVNSWTRQQWLDRVAWSMLGAALAHVVREYGISVRRASVTEMKANPKVKAFYSHDDMRRAWGGTTHTDPGPNFPWDRLFQAVNAALAGEDDDMTTPAQFLAILRDPSVAAEMRKLPWQYQDAGQPSAHGIVLVELRANLAKLAGADFTDEPAIVAGVLAGLSPEAIAAAIPLDLADRVADELARRLGTRQG